MKLFDDKKTKMSAEAKALIKAHNERPDGLKLPKGRKAIDSGLFASCSQAQVSMFSSEPEPAQEPEPAEMMELNEDTYSELPKNVQEILDTYDHDSSTPGWECSRLEFALNKVGYTIDWGLDCIPFLIGKKQDN